MSEIWKDHPDYYDLGCSTTGYVMSGDLLLKEETVWTGYRRVTFSRGGIRYHKYVHVLILETFVGPCPTGQETLHLDDDRTNNNLDNLRWGTRSENAIQVSRKGRNSIRRLTDNQVRDIRKLSASGYSQRRLARMFEVSKGTIQHVLPGGNSYRWLKEIV